MKRAAWVLSFLLFAHLAACSPCTDYCTEECRCAGTDTDECVDACLETMDLYSGYAQEAECTERLDILEDENCPGI